MEKNYLQKLLSRYLHLNWRTTLVLACFTIFGLNSVKGQVSSYIFTQNNSSFTSVSGTILAAATSNSGATSLYNVSYPLTLPFAFNFNGQSYSDLTVSSNGYVTFGAGAATNNTPISSAVTYNGAISAWGRSINSIGDVLGKSGNISWTVQGTAPNRVAIIQWENFRPIYSTSTTSVHVFSFQIKLSETTNEISTIYSAGSILVGTGAFSSTNAQIGLRGASSADFNNRTNPSTVAFTNSNAGIASGDGQSFNTLVDPPGMPADGLTYTWTPTTCIHPTALLVDNITTTSAMVSWTAPISAPANGYDIYYSTSSTSPNTTTSPTLSGVTGISQNLTSLTPATEYYVWVRSACNSMESSSWLGYYKFTTACNPVTYMYENFDSYITGSIVPICWDRIISGTGSQTINSGTPNSPPNNLYQYSFTPDRQTIVVLPNFSNINAGTHWIRLKGRVTTAPRTIEFGYVTDPTDANSFVLIEAKDITNTTYGAADSEYTIEVPATVPANARFAIKNPGTVSTTFYYDDVYWEPKPTCLAPTTVTVTNITTSTSTISWVASTSTPANGYDVYYSTINTAPVAASVPNHSNVMGLSQNLSGLAAATTFYVWVRSVCSTSDQSSWTALPSFTTECTPVATMFENFDSYAATSIVPDCWDRLIIGSGTQTISSTGANSGTRNLYQYSSSVLNQSIVILPPFSNINAGTHWLRLKARVTAAPRDIEFGYITDVNDANSFVIVEIKSITNTSYADLSAEYTFALPTTVPANARVAIKNAGGSSTITFYYDDVYWEVAPTCLPLANIAPSSVNTTTAEVSWTAPIPAAASGYDVYYSTTNSAPTAATVLNSTNSVSVGSAVAMANLTGLTPATTYYIWARAKCSSSDFSTYTSGGSFTTACIAFSAPFTESFSSGTIPNCWSNTSTDGSAGALWKFTGAPGYGATPNGSTVGTYAWVDASTPYTGGVNDVTLQTPLINLMGITDPGIQFNWFKNHSSSTTVTTLPAYDNNKLTVMVRDVATSTWETVFASDTNMASWRTQVITLNPSYINKTIEVRFIVDKNVAGNGYFYDDLLLDEIKVNSLALLGTSENSKEQKDVKLYPNPFTDIVNISDAKGLVSVSVTDLSGRLVKTINKPTSQINLGDLRTGMYLITLKYQNGESKSIKAIKK
ncbi:fibronectin type III domain-containing protein [Frigoriflavimonas asaccharolytica]|uniref:Fibronectin type-III domain-containing protein n=1 Tax=Frigoriflavimonas asaccharolytica TaxID=2735899 RepID=A0A8J8K874_9FLAO|nr:fibronectin type III domain-containing protein [Frigoriflavimonas asaccharolytica]NRS92296.1 hypothetical protein [Frigoriflavimonas asaccharolytica]